MGKREEKPKRAGQAPPLQRRVGAIRLVVGGGGVGAFEEGG